MAIHTPQEATLGKIEGTGFAFIKQTYRGKEIRGVFFGEEEDRKDLEALMAKEQVHFKGIVYSKLKSGKVTKRMESFVVDVQDLLSVRRGERADFEILAEA